MNEEIFKKKIWRKRGVDDGSKIPVNDQMYLEKSCRASLCFPVLARLSTAIIAFDTSVPGDISSTMVGRNRDDRGCGGFLGYGEVFRFPRQYYM